MNIAVVRNRSNYGVINRFGRPSAKVYGRKSVQRVFYALRAVGHTVKVFEGDSNLLSALRKFAPPDAGGKPQGLVFNMAYGVQGECRYTHIPATLEMAGVPYTGAGPFGHALCLDKVVAKILLREAGIPTPEFRVLRAPDESVEGLRYPLIVKPRQESTSNGLKLVHNAAALPGAVATIISKFQQDALVEEFIDGREVNIGLLGNAPVEVLPPVELDFGTRALRIETCEDKDHKRRDEPQKHCPAPLSSQLLIELRHIASATFAATHCRDYAHIDIRIDRDGRPFVLEINSMASLGRRGSYVLAAHHAGYDFPRLIDRIVAVAHERYAGLSETPAWARPAPEVTATPYSRAASSSHRQTYPAKLRWM